MNTTERAARLREGADALRRLQAGFLGPVSASPFAMDTLKDAVDAISFDVWRMECALDDAAERLAPWPCFKLTDLDRGKTVEAGK
jgi:hypothetical protein